MRTWPTSGNSEDLAFNHTVAQQTGQALNLIYFCTCARLPTTPSRQGTGSHPRINTKD